MIRRKPTRGGGFVDAYQPVWMFNSRNSQKISLLQQLKEILNNQTMLENCSRFNGDFGFYTVMETSGKPLELEKPWGRCEPTRMGQTIQNSGGLPIQIRENAANQIFTNKKKEF